MSPSIRLFSVLLLLLAGARCLAQQPSEAARKAKAVLEKHCHVCHGKNGAAEGGFGHLLDRDHLVAARTIVPGSPDKSKLYLRLIAEKRVMPPLVNDNDGKPITVRPTKEERDAIRDWIAAGAPDFNLNQPARKFIASAAVFEAIVADLNRAPTATDRLNRRYLSVAHLHNAAAEVGLPVEQFRAALAKSEGEVRRQFGSLLTGGTVKREVMVGHFRDLEKAVSSGR